MTKETKNFLINAIIVLISSLIPVVLEYLKSMQSLGTESITAGTTSAVLLAFKNYRC